ncbi:uncharacterized protein UTRI_04545 [Ustilago trichophora]|uniref:Uncharacterized protein n=1 Tax=Ustilago trichophora TaxID=86804 RepID=A0A5C3EG23_9BASI|nr:uncharacterized protein UTRI_04545 [Ustilago trichophora]
MKFFFARLAMIMVLVTLAIAAPILEGGMPSAADSVSGAAGSVIREQTSMIPEEGTAAPVTPPKKSVRFAEPLVQPDRAAEPLVVPKKTVRWAGQIATPLEPLPTKDSFTLPGEALGGAEQRFPAVFAENAAPRPPPKIRLKSPYPHGWGQTAPAVEVKSMSSQGRSWLPSWKPSSWTARFSRPTGWTWANAAGRNNLQTTAGYFARNQRVAPNLFKQNASVGRAIVSKPSWMQSLTEGARGFFGKAAAPFRYFHGI